MSQYLCDLSATIYYIHNNILFIIELIILMLMNVKNHYRKRTTWRNGPHPNTVIITSRHNHISLSIKSNYNHSQSFTYIGMETKPLRLFWTLNLLHQLSSWRIPQLQIAIHIDCSAHISLGTETDTTNTISMTGQFMHILGIVGIKEERTVILSTCKDLTRLSGVEGNA